MIIRYANDNDINSLINLLYQVNKVHAQERCDIFKLGTKYTHEELKEIIKDKDRPILIACDKNNTLLGYAFCEIKITKNDNILMDRKTLYIDDLCVDENHRREHIGQELYESCKQLAKELNCNSITLNVWALNENAILFYEKMGLKPLKTTMEDIIK